MKKYVGFVLVVVAVVLFLFSTPKASAAEGFQTTAKAACVVEQSSGRVLFEKNSHQKLPMASTTKIVTALTVLNNCRDLESKLEIPAQACGVEGSSVYLRAGEHLSVRELLLGLMLRSGNDCAVALALHVGGSVQNFAKLMNETAASAGCTESNFVTPHGLHCDDHYTTASDLAKVTCAAMNNEIFREIVSAKSATISNEGQGCDRVLANKNKLLFSFDGANGVKTGYTKKAGRCFVGSAKRNGMQVVAVLLDCGPMFEECADLLEMSFERFSLRCIVPQNKLCGVVYRHGQPTYYLCDVSFFFPLQQGEGVQTKITLDQAVQKLQVSFNGEIVFSQDLVAAK